MLSCQDFPDHGNCHCILMITCNERLFFDNFGKFHHLHRHCCHIVSSVNFRDSLLILVCWAVVVQPLVSFQRATCSSLAEPGAVLFGAFGQPCCFFPCFPTHPPPRERTSTSEVPRRMTHAKALWAPARACLSSPGLSRPSCFATPRLTFLGCI